MTNEMKEEVSKLGTSLMNRNFDKTGGFWPDKYGVWVWTEYEIADVVFVNSREVIGQSMITGTVKIAEKVYVKNGKKWFVMHFIGDLKAQSIWASKKKCMVIETFFVDRDEMKFEEILQTVGKMSWEQIIEKLSLV